MDSVYVDRSDVRKSGCQVTVRIGMLAGKAHIQLGGMSFDPNELLTSANNYDTRGKPGDPPAE
jgi:hypothetical protein